MDSDELWGEMDSHESSAFAENQPGSPFQGIVPSSVLSGASRSKPSFPEVGTQFDGFDLIGELGKGAFGRVYLAQQGQLANRPVALKISTEIFDESQKLAQLQHTNIVPIYSFHQKNSFQAVCMPYFGATTLGDVLRFVIENDKLPESGKGLVTTLQDRRSRTLQSLNSSRKSRPIRPSAKLEATQSSSESSEIQEPASLLPEPAVTDALQKLEKLSYPDAILWIVSHLADGLAHAHDRGILHRDLKPANILLTDEGQPMLLDFNLSEDIKHQDQVENAKMGGTLPYMAPEHLEAFRGNAHKVDERSDLYSLGVVLYELLTGRSPFPQHPEPAEVALPRMIEERSSLPTSLLQWNPELTPATESIVFHCLQPDPDKRYQSARDLQEDLERQLADLPLKHAPEPSFRERMTKWTRRHPRLASTSAVASLAGAILLILSLVLVQRSRALARLEALDNFEGFETELHSARLLLCARSDDSRQLEEGKAKARQALERYQVLQRANWRESDAMTNLPPEKQRRVPLDAGELLQLLASAAMPNQRPPDTDSTPAERHRWRSHWLAAQTFNERAEQCYGEHAIPRALWLQRATISSQLGEEKRAEAMQARAEKTPVRSAWEHYMFAREQAMRYETQAALDSLKTAVRMDPKLVAAQYMLGNLYFLQDSKNVKFQKEAKECFTACIALEPNFHALYLNRGLACFNSRDYEQAKADFDKAIELRPDVGRTYVHRAVVYHREDKYKQAEADLTRAIDLGCRTNRVYLFRAIVRRGLQDYEGAKKDRQEGLERTPTDVESWLARGIDRASKDPEGALRDFVEAVRLNPRLTTGWHNQAYILSQRMGKTREAIERLDRALKYSPNFVASLAGRGLLWAHLGQREPALRDAKRALEVSQSPETKYRVASIYAMTSPGHPEDREKAMNLLSEALMDGFGWEHLPSDDDFAPLRDVPEFVEVCEMAKQLRKRQQAENAL